MSMYLRFALFWSLSVVAFLPTGRTIVGLAWSDDRYSHTVLMPFITLGLIWFHRDRIFLRAAPCPSVAIPFLLAASAGGLLFRTNPGLAALATLALDPNLPEAALARKASESVQ